MRWLRLYLVDLALLYLTAFGAGLAWGTSAIATSPNGTVAEGWSGSPPEQVFWWAVAFVFYLASWVGPPILAIALVLHQVVTRAIGQPRLVAYLVALAFSLLLVVSIPRTSPIIAIAVAAPSALVYATIVRLPNAWRSTTTTSAALPR